MAPVFVKSHTEHNLPSMAFNFAAHITKSSNSINVSREPYRWTSEFKTRLFNLKPLASSASRSSNVFSFPELSRSYILYTWFHLMISDIKIWNSSLFSFPDWSTSCMAINDRQISFEKLWSPITAKSDKNDSILTYLRILQFSRRMVWYVAKVRPLHLYIWIKTMESCRCWCK